MTFFLKYVNRNHSLWKWKYYLSLINIVTNQYSMIDIFDKKDISLVSDWKIVEGGVVSIGLS